MTSEFDSAPHRRPPTIELTAKEVESEKPASTSHAGTADSTGDRTDEATPSDDPASNQPAGRPRSRVLGLVVGLAVGAVAMAAILVGLWMAGLAPPRDGAVLPAAPGPQPAATNEISTQLDKIQAALAAQRPEAALAERVAASEAQTKSLGDLLAALNRRVDDIAAATQTAQAQAAAASAAAVGAKTAADGAKTAAQASVQRSDLDALTNRIATLEHTVKTLSDNVTRRGASADDRLARMTVVTEALRATVERGAPYRAELAAVKSFGVDQTAIAPLEPFAATGIPSAAALAHELAALTPDMRPAAGTVPNDNSFLGRLENNAQKLVRVTPVDAPAGAGDDPSTILARINIDAARADIAGALADIARLPEAQRALAAAWVKKADARNAALAASRQIASDALGALAKPASQ